MAEPNPLRSLPSVSSLLQHPDLASFVASVPQCVAVRVIRETLDATRQQITSGSIYSHHAVVDQVKEKLRATLKPSLQVVINATGIILHTNLGRAPMAEIAARAAYESARSYTNLELDLSTGKRSSRQDHVRELLCELTGAESATVVNNCAAATMLVLRVLAAGREVIVSRGQLVEIGGSFRIPDIMSLSGAKLCEVGTTNRTRIADYRKAVNPHTAALMRVHSSNFKQIGFTESASISELVALGREHNIPVIDDVGSGAVDDLSQFDLEREPGVRDGIASGADVVLFSGDKLLGGPQAGIIAGSAKWIKAIEADPMMRALRCDKMTLAALEETLRLRRDPARAKEQLPLLQMLHVSLDKLRQRADELLRECQIIAGLTMTIAESVGYLGGGSLPGEALKSIVVQVRHETRSESQLSDRLRLGHVPVLARVHAGCVHLDLRTVFPSQDTALVAALRAAVLDV